MATAFHRNHRLNGEGGRIVEEWFAENVIDRIETTGSTWMGLTMNCCRCHDHKYDPISQKEFYQFFAYFNSNNESGRARRIRRFGGTHPCEVATPPPVLSLADRGTTAADRLKPPLPRSLRPNSLKAIPTDQPEALREAGSPSQRAAFSKDRRGLAIADRTKK